MVRADLRSALTIYLSDATKTIFYFDFDFGFTRVFTGLLSGFGSAADFPGVRVFLGFAGRGSG